MFLGKITGQALALFILLWKTRKDLRLDKTEDLPSLRELAVRYRKMPLLNGPNVMVDALRNNGMNLIVGLSGAGVLGQFSKAQGILQVPMGFITASVTQVFYQRMAVVKPGGNAPVGKERNQEANSLCCPGVYAGLFTGTLAFRFPFRSTVGSSGLLRARPHPLDPSNRAYLPHFQHLHCHRNSRTDADFRDYLLRGSPGNLVLLPSCDASNRSHHEFDHGGDVALYAGDGV